MSEDRLHQIRRGFAADTSQSDEPPDLGPLRALAEREELADAAGRLTDAYGRPPHATGCDSAPGGSQATGVLNGRCTRAGADLDRVSMPEWPGPDGAYRAAGQQAAGRSAPETAVRAGEGEGKINVAALLTISAPVSSQSQLLLVG